MCNNFLGGCGNGCSWIIILLIIWLCCSGSCGSCGGCGCGDGNCNSGCGC